MIRVQKEKAAQQGMLSLRFGLGWAKSHSLHTGQTPVLKYNRQLMQAILWGRLPIGEIVNVRVINLDQAPRGLPQFRCRGTEQIRDRPAWAGAQGGLALEDNVVITLSDARRVIAAAEAKAREIDQPMNIAVVDDRRGNLVSHVRMDGGWIGSIDISMQQGVHCTRLDLRNRAARPKPASRASNSVGIHARSAGAS